MGDQEIFDFIRMMNQNRDEQEHRNGVKMSDLDDIMEKKRKRERAYERARLTAKADAYNKADKMLITSVSIVSIVALIVALVIFKLSVMFFVVAIGIVIVAFTSFIAIAYNIAKHYEQKFKSGVWEYEGWNGSDDDKFNPLNDDDDVDTASIADKAYADTLDSVRKIINELMEALDKDEPSGIKETTKEFRESLSELGSLLMMPEFVNASMTTDRQQVDSIVKLALGDIWNGYVTFTKYSSLENEVGEKARKNLVKLDGISRKLRKSVIRMKANLLDDAQDNVAVVDEFLKDIMGENKVPEVDVSDVVEDSDETSKKQSNTD